MNAGRDAREPPGGRPPPKRTYGSKQSSRQTGVRSDQAQNQTLSSTDEGIISGSNKLSVPPKEQSGLRPELANNRLTSGETYGSGLRSLARSGAGVRFSTADEVSQLVRSAGDGGEEGRACAIALAQACKSHETRRAIRASGGGILDELTGAILVALRGDGRRQRDEGIVHCLSVALFILSKDRSLGTAFSASVVSILAFLIGGEQHPEQQQHQHGVDADEEERSSRSRTTTTSAAAAGVALLPIGASSGSAQRIPTTMGTLSDQQQGSSKAGDGGAKGSSINSCVFDMSEEEDDDAGGLGTPGGGIGAVGKAPTDRPGAAVTKRPALSFSANSSKNSKVGSSFSAGYSKSVSTSGKAQAVVARTDDNGAPKVMVRARMLLDIADILPWGMANRHLVSAADLGLATLLNVAAQACPEGGKGGGAAGDSAGGDSESMQDEASTQGSVGSQSDPSSALVAATDGRASSETAARKAGVMLELSRLAPTGFLLPLVVGGAAVLKDLSTSLAAGGARGAAADPSSLKAAHQLLLALRLLDLATLEQPAEGGEAAKGGSAEGARPGQTAELTDALLMVVARCQPFHGDIRAAGRRKEPAPDERGRLWAGREKPERQQQPLGDKVAARIHECLLAALRVLINITHHDAKVCAEVAARGGLETLMSCLVERCEHKSQGAPWAGHGRTDSEAYLGDIANGDDSVALRETSLEDAKGTRDEGKRDDMETDGGDFDAQILTMGALINCVELKESAKNCATMASLTAYRRSRSLEGSRTGEQLSGGRGPSSKCLAPEFLAKLLVRCTRNFAQQLEGDRPDQGEEEPSSPSPRKQYGSITNGPRDVVSTSLEVASKAQSMTPTPAQGAEGGGGELMSHREEADLVLGGHCALLLGLLIREQEDSRYMVLSVLPGGNATLIVRVLEAFIALQYQAGVLTEEVVLAVQVLVEELELMEGLPQEDLHPFEWEDEDDVFSSGVPATCTTTSPRRAQKRPRSPTDTGRDSAQPSGPWDMDNGRSDDPDEVSLSVTADPRATAQGELTSPSWLVQGRQRGSSRPPGRLQLPAQAATSSSSSVLASDERGSTVTRTDATNASSTPPRQKTRAPGSPGSSWRIGGTSGLIGGTPGGSLGMGLGGGSAAGTRSWLSSSQSRTYGRRTSFGSKTWKKPTRALAGLRTSMLGPAGAASTDAGNVGGSGVGGGDGVGNGGGGVGPMSGRRRTTAGPNAILDLDGWSDSSNETPIKLSGAPGAKNAAATEAKHARAACAHYAPKNGVASNTCGGIGVGGGGGSAGNATEITAQARLEDRRSFVLSPRPAQGEDRRGPFEGSGASNGGVGGGKRATYGTAPGVPSTKMRPGPGTARREGDPRPQPGGEAGPALYGSSSGNLPQRVPSHVAFGQDDARDALRPPLGVGGGVRRQSAVSEQPKSTRGVFQADPSEKEDAGGRSKQAESRNVFDFDEESD